jgi:hypothetical protein
VNLQEMRQFLWTQLDVDDEEYPPALLDTYLSEGYSQTLAASERWPFLEHTWTLTKADGATTIDLPTDLDEGGVYSLVDNTRHHRLTQVANELAEDFLYDGLVSTAVPYFFTIWGGQIKLWNTGSDGEREFTLRGQRSPTAFPIGRRPRRGAPGHDEGQPPPPDRAQRRAVLGAACPSAAGLERVTWQPTGSRPSTSPTSRAGSTCGPTSSS